MFPMSKGSTGGSYMLYDLVKNGVGPLGIVNIEAESIVVIGAIVSDLPMVDRIDIGQIHTGDYVRLNATEGTVTVIPKAAQRLTGAGELRWVNCLLINAAGWSCGMVFARRAQQRAQVGILGGLYCSLLVNTVINLMMFLGGLLAQPLRRSQSAGWSFCAGRGVQQPDRPAGCSFTRSPCWGRPGPGW